MLKVYRRHLKSCNHREEGREYRRCRCPLWVDGFIGGQDIRKSLDTRDWQRAQDLAREWEAVGREQTCEEPISIQEACDAFVADGRARNLRTDTIAKYKLLSRELQEFMDARRVKRLCDAADLPLLLAFRGTWKNENQGALKKLDRLRGFFGFAVRNGWLSENPASKDKIKSPRVRERPTLPFTHEDMVQILAAAAARVEIVQHQAKDNARRLRGFILLLRYSGLRIGDAARCSVERLADGKLRLYTQKTGTHVHCPLPEFVVKELDALPRANERYWFWSGKGSGHGAATKWDELLRKVFDDAGLPDGHAHRFRDTFAVELLLAGVPIERVSILLGHSSVRITEKHYSPWVRERQEQAEADVRRTWQRDPLALMESETIPPGETKGTQEVHGETHRVM